MRDDGTGAGVWAGMGAEGGGGGGGEVGKRRRRREREDWRIKRRNEKGLRMG